MKLTKAAIMAMRPNISQQDAKRIFAQITSSTGWLEAKGFDENGNVIYGFRTGIDVEALGRYLEKEAECEEREAT